MRLPVFTVLLQEVSMSEPKYFRSEVGRGKNKMNF
jgi:hypothetical protein